MRKKIHLFVVGALCAQLAACGSSGDSVSSGTTSNQTGTLTTATPATGTASLRINFGASQRSALFATSSAGLGATATFTVQIFQAPNGPLLTQLSNVARTPANASTQDVTVGGLPTGSLILRVLFFDASGNSLGYSDQNFSLTNSTVNLTINSLTPGDPPPVGTATPTPTPVPSATPSPAATPTPTPTPVLSPSPSPTATPAASPTSSPAATPSPTPAATPSPTPAGTLSLTPASASLAILGTQAFKLSNGSTDVSANATFSTAQANVAVVSSAGVVTGIGGGTTQLTGAAAGGSGQASITVTGPTLQSVSISPNSFILTVPGTAQFKVTGVYSDGSSRDLTSLANWSSSSSSAATVSSSGLVTAVAGGSPTITASFGTVTSSTQGTTSPQVVPPFQPPAAPPASSPSPATPAAPIPAINRSFPLGVMQGFSATPGGAQFALLNSVGTITQIVTLTPITSTDLSGATADAAGTLYLPDSGSKNIYKLAAPYTGTPTLFATVSSFPECLILDQSGNLYVSEQGAGDRVDKITPGGVVSLFNALPNGAQVKGMAFDNTGNVYVATNGQGIFAYKPDGSTLTTFGNTPGKLTNAAFGRLEAMAFDPTNGNLVAVDNTNNQVHIISPTGSTVSSTSTALLDGPVGIVFDAGGDCFVSNLNSRNIVNYSPPLTGSSLPFLFTGVPFNPGGGVLYLGQ